MPTRKALLVGSMPFETEEDSMRRALAALGDYLFCLPDGEVGERTEAYPTGIRRSWVHTAIQANIDGGAFDIRHEPERNAAGFMVSPDDRWVITPRYAPVELVNHLDFGYLKYFREQYETFKRLRTEAGKPDLKFQVGVPTGIAIAAFSMPLLTALRYRTAFDRRIAHEVGEIVAAAGDDVVIQVEAPFETLVAARLPAFAVGLPVRLLTSLIQRFPSGTHVGIHLCLGDLNNETPTKLNVEAMLVRLTNRLVARWPQGIALDYVHFPLAEASRPPLTDASVYTPLGRVRLPAGTRFVAGFVHEKLDEQGHRAILAAIEKARGEMVDVACSCGLGRRTPEVAEHLFTLTSSAADMA